MSAETAEEPIESIRRVASTTLATNLAITGTGLLIVVVIGRVLGPAGRGDVAAFQLVPLIGALVFALGLQNAASYFAAVAPATARQVVGSSTFVAVVVAVPGAAVTALVTWAYLASDDAPGIRAAGAVYSASVVLLAVATILVHPQRSVQRTQTWNVLRYLLDSSLAAAAIFVLIGQRSLVGMAIAQLVWVAVVIVVAAVPWWRRRPRVAQRVTKRQLVAYGAPTMLATLPYFLNFRVDQLILNAVRGSEQLGLYATAVSVSAASLPLVNTVSMLALPRLAGQTGTDRSAARDRSAGRFVRTSIVISGAAAVALAAVAPVAILVLFGQAFAESVALAVPLAFVTALLGVTTTAEEVLRAYGEVHFPARTQMVGLAVNVALLAVLIPAWGAWGAVVASAITYCGVCVAVLGRVRRVADLDRAEMIPTAADVRVLWELRHRRDGRALG